MAKTKENEHVLPSRKISYAYTVAMCFAQKLEQNLRAILHVANYHGWGHPIELNEPESKRFKDEKGFIDKSTLGALLAKLRQIEVLKSQSALKALERVQSDRNELAHSFLSKVDFDCLTKQGEADVVARLERMAVTFYAALSISRTLREQLQELAEADHKKMEKLFGEF